MGRKRELKNRVNKKETTARNGRYNHKTNKFLKGRKQILKN